MNFARTAVFLAIGDALGGETGMAVAFMLALGTNAFATGRNPENAAVAATSGLRRQLERNEIVGVMAHELAHDRDTLTMTITATLAGAIGMLAHIAWLFGGHNNRNPPVGTILVLAAAQLDRSARLVDNETAERNPATARLFIINPLHAHLLDNLFATHPSTENRVRRLRRMHGPRGPWG